MTGRNIFLQAHNLQVGYAVLAYNHLGQPISVVWVSPSEDETIVIKKYDPRQTFPGSEASFGWHEQKGLVAYRPVEEGQGGSKVGAADGTDQFGKIIFLFDPRIGAWQPVA